MQCGPNRTFQPFALVFTLLYCCMKNEDRPNIILVYRCSKPPILSLGLEKSYKVFMQRAVRQKGIKIAGVLVKNRNVIQSYSQNKEDQKAHYSNSITRSPCSSASKS